MENRLHIALNNLRSQCRVTSAERTTAQHVQPSSPRDQPGKITRDLQRLLVQARSNEADLQDEVDSMKCEIADYKFRIKELEGIVDEWHEKFEREAVKVKSAREELETRLAEARQQITGMKESCRREVLRKDDEVADLTKRLSEFQVRTCPLRVDSGTQMDQLPGSLHFAPALAPRPYVPLTYTLPPPRRILDLELMSTQIPDLGRTFANAATSPLFRMK